MAQRLRIDRAVFARAAILALPTLALWAAGIWFLAARVPVIARAERAETTRAYRDFADELRHHPETATYAGEKPATWRARRGYFKGADGLRTEWGYEPAPNGLASVWIKAGAGVRAVTVPALPTDDSATTLALIVLGGLALVTVLASGCLFFIVRLVRERDDFLAATAHDLTTPLVALRLTIGRDDAEARQLNERMIRLVDNVKAFLRLGGRRPAPERERVDLVAAYEEAYAVFRADYRDLFDDHDVPCSVSGVAQGERVTALADSTLTVQILWNLLGNALKYAAPHGPVAVRISAGTDVVRVIVADQGPGLTAHQRRHAFDRYYRAEPTLRTGKGGFGIGLCVARDFARAMGGDLRLQANEPRGCLFELTLPRASDEGTNELPKRQLVHTPRTGATENI